MNVCLLIDGSFLEVTVILVSASPVFSAAPEPKKRFLAKLEADNSFGPNTD